MVQVHNADMTLAECPWVVLLELGRVPRANPLWYLYQYRPRPTNDNLTVNEVLLIAAHLQVKGHIQTADIQNVNGYQPILLLFCISSCQAEMQCLLRPRWLLLLVKNHGDQLGMNNAQM